MNSSQTTLTDSERQLILVLVTKEWVRLRYLRDTHMKGTIEELDSIINKLFGVDTKVIVEKIVTGFDSKDDLHTKSK